MKGKVIQFTISERNMKIIESFTKKYGTSKSDVVNKAIEHLAGQYHKKLIISYELTDDKKADELLQRQVIRDSKDEDDLLTDEEFRHKYFYHARVKPLGM